jgi:hypothetical protein
MGDSSSDFSSELPELLPVEFVSFDEKLIISILDRLSVFVNRF